MSKQCLVSQLLAGYQPFYCVNCYIRVKLICDTLINYYLLTYLLTYLYEEAVIWATTRENVHSDNILSIRNSILL